MAVTHSLSFSLALDREQWLKYYAGHASAVQVRTDGGLLLRLPASALRQFVTHNGVHGRFTVTIDQAHKLVEIQPCTPQLKT